MIFNPFIKLYYLKYRTLMSVSMTNNYQKISYIMIYVAIT